MEKRKSQSDKQTAAISEANHGNIIIYIVNRINFFSTLPFSNVSTNNN